MDLSIVKSQPQFIVAKIVKGGEPPWFAAFVYRLPNSNQGKVFWNDLESVLNSLCNPIIVTRDFNAIAFNSENKGGSMANSNKRSFFADWITKQGLIDLGFVGSPFT